MSEDEKKKKKTVVVKVGLGKHTVRVPKGAVVHLPPYVRIVTPGMRAREKIRKQMAEIEATIEKLPDNSPEKFNAWLTLLNLKQKIRDWQALAQKKREGGDKE